MNTARPRNNLVYLLIIVAIGAIIFTALRTNALSWSEGARVGLVSGLVAATVVFIVVIVPTNAWQATVPLLAYSTAPSAPLPHDDVITTFVQSVLVHAFMRLLPIALLAGAFVTHFLAFTHVCFSSFRGKYWSGFCHVKKLLSSSFG